MTPEWRPNYVALEDQWGIDGNYGTGIYCTNIGSYIPVSLVRFELIL